MASQAQLLPSLYALLPADQLDLMLSRLSLLALHAEGYQVRDDVYLATHPVIPGQNRTLRLRARRRRRRRVSIGNPRWSGVVENADRPEGWAYSLAWVSPPLSGREHSEMRTQAYVGLDVAGMSQREDIESFVEALGFK